MTRTMFVAVVITLLFVSGVVASVGIALRPANTTTVLASIGIPIAMFLLGLVMPSLLNATARRDASEG